MNSIKKYLANKRLDNWLLIAAVLVFVFWFIGKKTNVYKYAIEGAIFEILWLPMVAALLIIPLISIAKLITQPIKISSLAIYTMLISIGTILLLELA